MSKFHVGDEVRVAAKDSMCYNRVGTVIGVEYGDYPYAVQFGPGSSIYGFKEEELRPAKIEALSQAEVAFPAHVVESLSKVASGDLSGTVEYRPLPVAEARDSVNHPAHYTRFPVEVIEITEQLDFNRGNAVKYLCRAGFKEGVDEMEDLSKAAWYINRAIEKLQKERAGE